MKVNICLPFEGAKTLNPSWMFLSSHPSPPCSAGSLSISVAWEHVILWLLEQYYCRAWCYERAFDDLAGGRLLNLEFEMLGLYETPYFKQLWDPLKLWISSRNKIPCRFQCSNVLRGFENGPPAVLHTWTLPLQKYPNLQHCLWK